MHGLTHLWPLVVVLWAKMYRGQGCSRIQLLKFQGHCYNFVSNSFLLAFDMWKNVHLDTLFCKNQWTEKMVPLPRAPLRGHISTTKGQRSVKLCIFLDVMRSGIIWFTFWSNLNNLKIFPLFDPFPPPLTCIRIPCDTHCFSQYV